VVESVGTVPRYAGRFKLSNRDRILIALVLALALLMTAATPAFAVTKAQKMAQARAVKSQIDTLNTQIEVANERYNVAAAKYAALVRQVNAAARREAKARKRIRVLQRHLGTRASDMYRTGPLGFLDVLLGAKSFDELSTTWDILKTLNNDDADAIGEMKVAKAEATAAHKEFATKRDAAKKQKDIKAAQTASFRRMRADRAAKLRGIQTEIRQIEAAEQAAARAAARRGSYGGSDGGNWPTPSIPAHGSVVQYAKSRIGCPYVWAASGPGAFDCSGLTMWCYRQIGISLPHSSAAQINSGQRVSRANIQPGDLVFFGSPIHHVGMYVGGGMMIEAPYTGARVRYAPAFRGDYVGACRPN
jgi:peptidoglycan DL-endopeptidase CwlO